jgi:hypothetical protein
MFNPLFEMATLPNLINVDVNRFYFLLNRPNKIGILEIKHAK